MVYLNNIETTNAKIEHSGSGAVEYIFGQFGVGAVLRHGVRQLRWKLARSLRCRAHLRPFRWFVTLFFKVA